MQARGKKNRPSTNNVQKLCESCKTQLAESFRRRSQDSLYIISFLPVQALAINCCIVIVTVLLASCLRVRSAMKLYVYAMIQREAG